MPGAACASSAGDSRLLCAICPAQLLLGGVLRCALLCNIEVYGAIQSAAIIIVDSSVYTIFEYGIQYSSGIKPK